MTGPVRFPDGGEAPVLGQDHLDLYLLHWAGSHPLRETIAAFEALQARGLIRRWGVSNFDLEHMQALFARGRWPPPGLQALARPRGCSAAQLAPAWTMRHPQVMPIPKARNLAAASLVLDAATLAALEALFPPSSRRQPLAMT